MQVEVLGQENLRPHNLAALLTALRDFGPRSRSQLATMTNLSKTGVANLIDELVQAGLVVELGQVRKLSRGRPATELTINAPAVCAIGIQLRAFGTRILITDMLGVPLMRERIPADRSMSPEQRIAELGTVLHTMLQQLGIEQRVAGIGVSLPGFLSADGFLHNSPSMGWRDVALQPLFRKYVTSGLPLHFGSVSTYSALAEYRVLSRSEMPGIHSVAHLELHVGVGSHLAIRGEPQLGAAGALGGLGHVVIEPNGPACACGRNGCIESLVGLYALLSNCAPDLLDTWGTNPEFQMDEVFRRASNGDETTIKGFLRLNNDIARAVSILASLFDPSVIVLGGYAPRLTPWLLPDVERLALAMTENPLQFRVVTSPLGMDAALTGATQVVLDGVFEAPLETVERLSA